MTAIVIKIIKNGKVTDEDLVEELFNMCDDSNFCEECPIHEIQTQKEKSSPNCDCQRNGGAMLKKLREHYKK